MTLRPRYGSGAVVTEKFLVIVTTALCSAVLDNLKIGLMSDCSAAPDLPDCRAQA